MADTTKIWPIFRWANWWLSDDLFTGIKNSFYYSNDMEIRQDAKSIFPKPVPAYADENTRIAIWDASTNLLAQQPKCVFYSYNDYWWVVCGARKIYLIADAWSTVTELCTMPEDILDAEVFNWYIYVATKTYLYYKKDNWLYWTNMAAATGISEDEYGRCVETLTSSNYHPLYWAGNVLCVWDVSKVRKVTREVWNVIQDWFAIQDSWEIRFLNELWWFVRATSFDWPYWCSVLLWDKVSSYPDEVIPMEWYYVLQSAIYNWYQYLLTDKWLWLLNWYQYYLLKKVDWWVTSTAKNGMCVWDDKLYFVANDWIYIYWAKNKNYADVVNLWHKVEDWFKIWAIWSSLRWLCVTRSWYHDLHDADLNVPVYAWINEGMATDGEVETMCYFWSSMSEIKQSMYLRVGYHIPVEWGESWNIHIYYRTEADARGDNPEERERHEATKPEWLYADWDMRSPFATTLKLNCRFQWIQFRFVLTNCIYDDNWTTKTKDTNLYSADLYYNDMLD
jgi:hypothetical protein